MQRSKDMRCSHKALFNHLVGELLQIERHLEAKHLGGREIDDEIELRGPLDRQVARSLTLENAGGVDANPAIAIGGAGAVAQFRLPISIPRGAP